MKKETIAFLRTMQLILPDHDEDGRVKKCIDWLNEHVEPKDPRKEEIAHIIRECYPQIDFNQYEVQQVSEDKIQVDNSEILNIKVKLVTRAPILNLSIQVPQEPKEENIVIPINSTTKFKTD